MIEWEIIAKKIAGLTTATEDTLFEQWINESLSHAAYYKKALHEFQHPTDPVIGEQEMDELIKQFERLATEGKRKKPFFSKKQFIRVAAVWLLFAAGISFWYLYKNAGSNDSNTAAAILPGESKASIALSNGEVLTLDGSDEMLYMDGTSGIVITQKGGLISYKHKDYKITGQKAIAHTLTVPKGGEYTLELSDGTKIWLNAMTTLRFPVRFPDSTRFVELNGEAYFEVTHNNQSPFIVNTASSQIKVYGTKFNVSAYAGEPVQSTTLSEGSVSVTYFNGKEIFLKPGEQAILAAGDKIMVKKVNTELYTSWHTGSFLFENETLDNIMNKLSKWYAIDVRFEDDNLRNLHFTGELKRYENLDQILRMIQMTCSVNFEIEDSVLLIKPKNISEQ